MTKKKMPKQVKFYLADDIRVEGQKPLILGLFADDSVGVEMPSEVPEPTKELPVLLQGLAVLTSFIDCQGHFEARISLYGPDGVALFENQPIEGGIGVEQSKNQAMINFVAKFSPFGIPAFGTYKFRVGLDKKVFDYEFKVVRRNKS